MAKNIDGKLDKINEDELILSQKDFSDEYNIEPIKVFKGILSEGGVFSASYKNRKGTVSKIGTLKKTRKGYFFTSSEGDKGNNKMVRVSLEDELKVYCEVEYRWYDFP